MDSSTAVELLDLLDEQIDDLEPAIEPLLKDSISGAAVQLPVVDKAKLYVLTSYVLESLLFSYLKLNNADLKSHAIMSELARVRSYMAKIKEAQPNMHRREMTINKEAVERIVNAGLAGNDTKNAELKATERAAALAKFNALSEKIEREATTLSKRQRQKQRKAKRNQETATAQRERDYDEFGEGVAIDGGDELVEGMGKRGGRAKAGEKVKAGVEGAEAEAEDEEVLEEKRAGSSKRTKQSKNRSKKRRKTAAGRE